MNKTSISIGVLASCVAAWALVTAYHVEPRSAAESGWTDTIPGQDYVSEIVTCCWDELDSTVGGYAEPAADCSCAFGVRV